MRKRRVVLVGGMVIGLGAMLNALGWEHNNMLLVVMAFPISALGFSMIQ